MRPATLCLLLACVLYEAEHAAARDLRWAAGMLAFVGAVFALLDLWFPAPRLRALEAPPADAGVRPPASPANRLERRP